MGCGPLPNWLRDKHCIYAIQTFDDNLSVWRCLAIYKRKDIKRGTEFVTRDVLGLAYEYQVDNKLKKKYVGPTKLEAIAKHHNMNIMSYEPKKDKRKDAGSIWWLVYGKMQDKNDLPTINMGMLGVSVFISRR